MSENDTAQDRKAREPNWRGLTQAQVLRALNQSPHTLYAWEANGCPSKVVDGKKTYDLRHILDWRVAFRRDPEVAREEAGMEAKPGESTEALERWRLARAKKAEDELALSRGQLVTKEEVDLLHRNTGDFMRQGLQLLARKVGNRVVAAPDQAAVEEIIQAEVNALLKVLSEWRAKEEKAAADIIDAQVKEAADAG